MIYAHENRDQSFAVGDYEKVAGWRSWNMQVLSKDFVMIKTLSHLIHLELEIDFFISQEEHV